MLREPWTNLCVTIAKISAFCSYRVCQWQKGAGLLLKQFGCLEESRRTHRHVHIHFMNLKAGHWVGMTYHNTLPCHVDGQKSLRLAECRVTESLGVDVYIINRMQRMHGKGKLEFWWSGTLRPAKLTSTSAFSATVGGSPRFLSHGSRAPPLVWSASPS